MLDYFIEFDRSISLADVASRVYQLACRTGFSQPGFSLVRMPGVSAVLELRREIRNLKQGLSDLYFRDTGFCLGWFSVSLFDQKNTTKPHRDGAPEQSLLILGYAPTSIESRLSIADYSKCAFDMGITPEKFLEDFNPMYELGLEKLAAYTTEIEKFDSSFYQMLVVNNSCMPFDVDKSTWQGVLHSAKISGNNAERLIVSTCVYPIPCGEPESVNEQQVNSISQAGY